MDSVGGCFSIKLGLCGGTEFSQVRFKCDKEKAAKVYENIAYLSPEDISAALVWIIEQPKHVNINRLEIMPTAQSFAGLSVSRNEPLPT